MNQPNWRLLKKTKSGFSLVQKHSLRRNSNEKTEFIVQLPKSASRKRAPKPISNESRECEVHVSDGEDDLKTKLTRHKHLIELSENIPYVTLGIELGELDEDLAQYFMAGSSASDRVTSQTELVASFCSGDTVKELKGCHEITGSECVALLDDRTNDGSSSVARAYLGPLTAHRLYLELAGQRFPTHGHTLAGKMMTENGHSDSSHEGGQPLRRNADRRLIFITNLNRWAVMALILTASEQQAWALRDSLYRHLAFRPFVGRMTPSHGLKGFQMAFDLPYFALRTALIPERLNDDRKSSTGFIRKVMDVSFLARPRIKPAPRNEIKHLYSAQISALVTGTDALRWVAYCFVDTYFELENAKESVDDYHEYIGSELDPYPDPFTGGHTSSNPPVLHPTEYFLTVLEFRIRQVRAEWETLAIWLRQQVDTYIQTCPITNLGAPFLRPASDLELVKRSRHWGVRTKMLLLQVSQTLAGMLSHWESTEREELFGPLNAPGMRCLSTIRADFKQLETVSKDLDALRRICDDYDACLLFYLNHEGGQDAKIQARIARFGQIMTLVMLGFISPIALAASILSMEPTALPPPLGPNSTSFIILAIIFSCIVWLAVGIMLKWDQVRSSIRRLIGLRTEKDDLESIQCGNM